MRLARDRPESAGLEVLERLHQLGAGVHHEGAVRRDGLADGLVALRRESTLRGLVPVIANADYTLGDGHREPRRLMR